MSHGSMSYDLMSQLTKTRLGASESPGVSQCQLGAKQVLRDHLRLNVVEIGNLRIGAEAPCFIEADVQH